MFAGSFFWFPPARPRRWCFNGCLLEHSLFLYGFCSSFQIHVFSELFLLDASYDKSSIIGSPLEFIEPVNMPVD